MNETTSEPDAPSVLFLCGHNAGRSQMAAGWLRSLAGPRARVFSGGSNPSDDVNPTAVEAMAELGIDISSYRPQRWTIDQVEAADVVVSMGCGDSCPVLPGKRYEDWELTDPAGQSIEVVRSVRDEIRSRVVNLLGRTRRGRRRLVTDRSDLARRLTAEFVGTAFLLAGVVGSGIMAERLSTDVGLQLFQNAFATAGILVALILALQPASGAHFNPAVTVADRLLGGIDTATGLAYVVVQVTGGALGVILANLMFELDAVNWSTKERVGTHLVLAEAIATFGLILVIYGVVRTGKPTMAAFTVGGYIAAAYYFTSSTSFANPAVTLARTLSDTFAGIQPSAAPAFLAAQVVGAVAAAITIRYIYPAPR